MRWPLKYQIMVPMTAVMLATVVAVTFLQAYLAAEQTRTQTATRIRDVTNTLAGSQFPMTDAVLHQMKGLSGADFVLQDATGQIAASTRSDWRASDLPRWEKHAGSTEFQLAKPVTIQNERLFHSAIDMRPQELASPANRLHVFYSENVYLQKRRQAALPAIGIGALATVLVIGLALITAFRVSRPLGQLREQVQRIAHGDFQRIALPRRDDEVRALSKAVNQMAETLAQYEQQIRRTEQVRLLAQLGGGLAHQLRNSATGARMALDIHRGECQAAAAEESLEVATRQLVLMEKYLARFLSLGGSQSRVLERLDWAHMIVNLLPLVQPAARHTGVELQAEIADQPLFICGDPNTLEHMVLNLLINAVEAAGLVSPESGRRTSPPQVRVTLVRTAAGQAALTIEDTGPGPPQNITETMFEPFVTAKKDGVGLGLAVARDVALDHRGQLRWERVGSLEAQQVTRFTVELPLAGEGSESANTARS